MVKKSLNDKIKIVGFWTFGFVFWYLVIAFFLKSSYPIYEYSFNREDAYDAMKDALTLAAAFLAPAAAFVLFSDWRTQHVEQKVERLSEEIWSLNSRIIRKFYELQSTLDTGQTHIFINEKNTLNHDINEVKAKIFTLGGHKNIDIDNFIDKAFQVTNSMHDILRSFESIVEKIDQSLKVKGKDSDEYIFYNSGFEDDWSSDLIDKIGDLDQLNYEIFKITLTQKVNF